MSEPDLFMGNEKNAGLEVRGLAFEPLSCTVLQCDKLATSLAEVFAT